VSYFTITDAGLIIYYL